MTKKGGLGMPKKGGSGWHEWEEALRDDKNGHGDTDALAKISPTIAIWPGIC